MATFKGRYIHGGGGTFVSSISKSTKTVLSACIDMLLHAVQSKSQGHGDGNSTKRGNAPSNLLANVDGPESNAQ